MSILLLGVTIPITGNGGGNAPAGTGVVRVGSPTSFQTLRVGSNSTAPRIVIPTEA